MVTYDNVTALGIVPNEQQDGSGGKNPKHNTQPQSTVGRFFVARQRIVGMSWD
jgi:hypothetical protein